MGKLHVSAQNFRKIVFPNWWVMSQRVCPLINIESSQSSRLVLSHMRREAGIIYIVIHPQVLNEAEMVTTDSSSGRATQAFFHLGSVLQHLKHTLSYLRVFSVTSDEESRTFCNILRGLCYSS